METITVENQVQEISQDAPEKQGTAQGRFYTERQKELLELESRINAELDARLLANPNRHPKAVYFLLPNEFGERLCYYSISPNLNKYFLQITGMGRLEAKVFATAFTMLSYFFPLLGAALSDSFLGKWWTIISFSLVYLLGMILLTVFAIPNLLGPVGTVSRGVTFFPMMIIALGTGGIKPCLSSHGGDQYLPGQEKAKDRFFSLYYASINAGALIAQFAVPAIADRPCMGLPTCYPYAFLMPTIVFLLALVVFALGRRWYRIVPPVGEFLPFKAAKAAVLARARYTRATTAERAAKGHWLNFAEGAKYDGVFLDECRDFGASLAVVVVPLSFCKMLCVQTTSEWATQYYQMSGALFGKGSKVLAAQYTNINTILLVFLVPLLAYVVYPFWERRGWSVCLTRRMVVGYFCTIVAFSISAMIARPVEEAFVRAGRDMERVADYDGTYCEQCVSGWVQLPQWFLIALGESMFWPTGIQFMYVESGRQFRAVTSAFWLLTSALGSIWVTILDPAMVHGGLSTTTRNMVYCAIGLFGWLLLAAQSWFYVPRKDRTPINWAACEAKEAEYSMTRT